MSRVHFPDSKLIDNSYDKGQGQQNLGICERITNRGDWNLSRCMINQSKIRWALGIFKPFKSVGTYVIVSVSHFRACMAYGFILTAWRQVKVTFIPTTRKLYYTEAKAYHPISLSYFHLKTMEKLVDGHMRDGTLKDYPLHRNYHIGKSTETALHNVVTRIENAIEHKDIALGALLNIEGVFDRTSYHKIKQAAERHGIEPAVCRWICAMLESRI
jgi:hypothetical protein